MKFIIRKATIDDAYMLAEILTKSWRSAYKNIISADELQKHSDVEQRFEMFQKMLQNPRGEFYIAFDDEIPCGEFMFCKSRDADLPDYAEIVSIYAIEEYWGKGLGGDMMTAAIQKILEMGYTNILLWVFKDNHQAKKFYEKFGFTLDGSEKESVFTNKALEVRYILNLTK